ncbi:MAG: hypothetical protein HRT43_09070 [Campylobacteraceae bacterium]|nr:hypothetical protein [Campylobacteraceae bacterium]
MKKLLLILLFSILSFAETLKVGDAFPSITLDDQFEKTHTVSLESKRVLVAYDKSMSTILKEFLLEKEDDFLTKNKTVYIGDISGMPSLISRFFAIPKMKKYPFSILFLDDKNRNAFSKKEDFISVYTLENGKVKTLTHISTKEELGSLFN